MNLDLTSPETIKEILAKHEIKPSKGMGQNFLISKSILGKIIKSADLKTENTVLEVGPGIGTLTAALARVAKKVIAVEKDKNMCQILKETLNDYRNVEIINGDILKIENFELISNYQIVANIPYYLTSPLIRKFLENPPNNKQPKEIVLMVQKEVAQRICAKPPSMSILSVSVQFYAKAEIMFYVKKENFWPKPKVDSSIIKIVPHKNTPKISAKLFFKIVKAGFSQPRKQLINNLTTLKSPSGIKLKKSQITSWLSKNNINPSQRAETLSVQNWENLTKTLAT